MLIFDLQEDIQRRRREGSNIIVGGNWNENVRCEEFEERKDCLALHDVMLEKLGEDTVLPNT